MKDKQSDAFRINIHPDTVQDICEIASLLGIESQAIVAEALDDWMRCIAPVLLEDALAVLDADTATLRDRFSGSRGSRSRYEADALDGCYDVC